MIPYIFLTPVLWDIGLKTLIISEYFKKFSFTFNRKFHRFFALRKL
jgi:hypothetical protein